MTKTRKKWMMLLVTLFLVAIGNAADYDYNYNQGNIECPVGSEGVSYTLKVRLNNLGVPSGLSFDTGAGVTSGAPSRISISSSFPGTIVYEISFSGTIVYGLSELPTSDITISMNGKLVGSGGGGTQPTWSASGKCIAPFFITCNKEIIWIDSSTTLTASKEANWYIGSVKKHTGTSFAIGASANYTPIIPGEYIVTAKEKDDESNIDSRTIKVVKCTSLSVDVATPASTTINYKLEPSTVACSGIFEVGTNGSSTKSVSGDFNFTFNQDLIFVTSTPLSLKLSNSDLAEKNFSNSGIENNRTKTDTKSLHTYTLAEGQGYRYHSWGGSIKYEAHNYSVTASGKLLEFEALGGSSSSPSNRTAVAHATIVQGYTYAFINALDGTNRALQSNVANLSPSIFIRGIDFATKKNKNISSNFTIYPGFSTPDGPAQITTIAGGSFSSTLD